MSDCTFNANQEASKKRKINGSASDYDNDSSSDNGNESCSELAGVMKVMMDMQVEMKSMKCKMNEMENKLMKYDRLEEKVQDLRNQVEVVSCTSLEGHSSVDEILAVAVKAAKSLYSDMDESINAKLRFHKQLIDNQQWEYSAEPPEPYEDNEIEYDEDEMQLYTDMYSSIKSTTNKMRRGEHFGLGFGVISHQQGEDEDETFLHDEVMIPHWKEFADALAQYRHYLNQCEDRDLFRLCFCRVQLNSEVLEMLQKALEVTPFNELSLKYNQSGNNLVSFATKALQNNKRCKVLSMKGNTFESGDFVEVKNNLLWETVNNHPSITTLDLTNCFNPYLLSSIGSSSSLLGDALSRLGKLTNLDLSENGISGEKAIFVANFVGTNPSMLELNLTSNKINDDDAAKIAEGLAKNNTLRLLSMYRNHSMARNGAKTLFRAFFGDETSLNSVAASNHTCRIESDWRPLTVYNRRTTAPKVNRRQKLYHTLDRHYRKSSGGVLELIDNELPNDDKMNLACKLMPIILGSVQLYSTAASGEIDPLSIVYEIMKGWRMPLLYEKD